MRIALVSTPFAAVPPRGYGGTELVVAQLERGLAAAGHQVTLFATGDSGGADVRWVYERPVWPIDARAELVHCRAAAHAIARGRFDVVHAHAPQLLRWERLLGAPLVHTLHHARDERLLTLYRDHPGVRYVAISRRQAQLVPELSCSVIHHGLDPGSFPAGAGEGGFALFLGRLSHSKGLDLAVRAAAEAGLELVVAGAVHGEPDDPPTWREQVAEMLSRPGVRAVGPVAGRVKRELLGGARALLMPIRWEEPFGLVMIEAMLSGTPVVATRRGAAPEVVEDGSTGFLVEGEDELGPALRRTAAIDRAACRRRARERFGAARMVDDHLRLYRAVAAARALAAAGAPAAAEEGG
ncbi:MAG TPA: glycosyltransferase family 4 protein [Anaeromyxobacteraceae bacterium]|nr:glycosyltransferase family 4 protein [Anaeromyxobacteraceae bacterium]